MKISPCNKSDFNYIISHITDYWESDRTLYLHHPMLLYEFGDSAFVIRKNKIPIAYIFALIASAKKTVYVHLVAVHKDHRGNGLAKQLYDSVKEYAKSQGCIAIKAITTVTNKESLAFHTAIGMKLSGKKNKDGIRIVKDYSGPGEDRIVFWGKLLRSNIQNTISPHAFDEFADMLDKVQKQAKAAGLKKSDIAKIIQEVKERK